MVSNEFNTVVFPRDGQNRRAPPARIGKNRVAGPARVGIIIILAIIAGPIQPAALGQPPGVSIAEAPSPQPAEATLLRGYRRDGFPEVAVLAAGHGSRRGAE